MDLDNTILSTSSGPSFCKSKAGRFDQISITLHWATVLLVCAQFTTAWWFNQGGPESTLLLMLHRSMGIATLGVVVSRLIWRRTAAHLPPFPVSMPKIQKWAAQGVEFALYGLLLLQTLTGLGDTLFRGRAFVAFGMQIPKLLQANKPVAHLLHNIHELSAWVLLGFIGIHATAALFHGMIARDGVLQRMLPWTPRDM